MSTSKYITSIQTLLTAGLALATTGFAQDDRENMSPTAMRVESGLSYNSVVSRLNDGYRITDLEIITGSPTRYATTMVRNTGSYARGWWWFTNASPSTISTFLSNNNARLIDLEPRVSGNTVTYAAVMVSNTGSHAKGWWWYHGTTLAFLMNRASFHNARLVDVERYTVNGQVRYAGIMIRNTGADARGWQVLTNVTTSQISSSASQVGHRVYSIESIGNGRFDAITLSRPNGGKWWHYYNQTLAQVGQRTLQIGARCVDIERYSTASGTRYAIVLNNNSNALSTRLSEILRGGFSTGVKGAYIKRVNGPILGSIMRNHVFDPASVLKTLHLYGMMRQVRAGTRNLNTTYGVWDGCGRTCCPTRTNADTEQLRTTLQKMMRVSDNQSTLSVTDMLGGFNILNAFAAQVGANSTDINHHIGCGTPANRTTLADIGRIHEAVRNGNLGNFEDDFYDIMSRWNGGGHLDTVLTEEANRVGLTLTQRNNFANAIRWNSKGGSYNLAGPTYQRATGASVTLPFYRNGGIEDVAYVSGVFLDAATVNPSGNSTLSTAHAECYRLEIRAAMETWRDHVFGGFSGFSSGCAGSRGVPTLNGTGNPELGQTVGLEIGSTPVLAPVLFTVGISNRFWNRTRLPVSLGALGATGCFLRVSPDVTVASNANFSGIARLQLPVQNIPALIGQSLYIQGIVVDPAANALGLTTTRGLEMRIGGQP